MSRTDCSERTTTRLSVKSEVDPLEDLEHWMETSGVSADNVAKEIARAVQQNRFLLLTHAQTRMAWRLKRWMPNRYYKMIANRTSGKKRAT